LSVAEPEPARDLTTRLARRANGWPTLTGGALSSRLYARAERARCGPLALASAVAGRFETAATAAAPGALPLAQAVVGGTWSDPAIELPATTGQAAAAELPTVSPLRTAPEVAAATRPPAHPAASRPPDAPRAARGPATYAEVGAADAPPPRGGSGAAGAAFPTPPGAGAAPIVVRPMPRTRSASPLPVAGAGAAPWLEGAQDWPAAATGVDAPAGAPTGAGPAHEPSKGTSTGAQADAASDAAGAPTNMPAVQPQAGTHLPAGEGRPVVEPVIPAPRQATLPTARFLQHATPGVGQHAGAQPVIGPAQAGRHAAQPAPRRETERAQRRPAAGSLPPTPAISPARDGPVPTPLAAPPTAPARSEPAPAPRARAEPAGILRATAGPLTRTERGQTGAMPPPARAAEAGRTTEWRDDPALPTAVAHAVPSVATRGVAAHRDGATRGDADPEAIVRAGATRGGVTSAAAGSPAGPARTLVQRASAQTTPAATPRPAAGARLPVVRPSDADRSAPVTGWRHDAEPVPAAAAAIWSAPPRALILGREAGDPAVRSPQPPAPALAPAPPSPTGMASRSGPPGAASAHERPPAGGVLVLATQPPSGSTPRSPVAASVPIEPPAAPAPSAAHVREPDAEALAERVYGLIVRRLGHERARRGR
jgi:hypothetical protein